MIKRFFRFLGFFLITTYASVWGLGITDTSEIFPNLLIGNPDEITGQPIISNKLTSIAKFGSFSGEKTSSEVTTSAIAISVGGGHTCAIDSEKDIWCWGLNKYGQLGNGSYTDSLTPVKVQGLSEDVQVVSAGGSHTCALTISGAVKCWGYNDNGALGNGSTTNSPLPVSVTGLSSGIVDISAGGYITCAINSNRGLLCWGENQFGQIGDGSNNKRLTPVDVSGLGSGVEKVAAGAYHTCALMDDGKVKCWGDNSYGQLGNGNTLNQNIPVNVNSIPSDSIQIDAEGYHSCALTVDQGLYCWGYNNYGQLGNGTKTNSLIPVKVSNTSNNITAITTGGFHSCEIISGSVKCWGDNSSGQIGDGTNQSHSSPINVIGITNSVKSISAKGHFTCALSDSGGIFCWGDNTFGQLGNRSTNNSTSAVPVTGFGGEVKPKFSINHVEVSQAIQDKNNNVPLVDGKPTFVRVYVECLEDCFPIPPVSGTIRGYRGSIELPNSPLKSINGSTGAYGVDWTNQRGDINGSLNFTLPESWLSGNIILEVDVSGAVLNETLEFKPRNAIRIIYVPINFNDKLPDQNIINDASLLARKIFPTSNIVITQGSMINWDDCLIENEETCPKFASNRKKLLTRLTNLYQDSTDFVFGWLPQDTMNGGWSDPTWNKGKGRAAFGDAHPDAAEWVLAHEIAHLLGRRHPKFGDSCTKADAKADWPENQTIDTKIQEWGIDGYGESWLISSNKALKDPADVFDVMSNCGSKARERRWISPFNYQEIYGNLAVTENAVLESTASGEFMIISGLIYLDNTLDMEPIWKYSPTISPTNPPIGTQYCVEAQDELSNPIHSRCFDLSFYDFESGEEINVDAMNITLPYDETIQKIVVRKGTTSLYSIEASDNAPNVTVQSPNGGENWENDHSYIISWSSSDFDDNSLSFQVYYSQNGSDWIPLGLPTTQNQIEVNSNQIPGGSNAQIKVVASDGFHNSSDTSNDTFFVQGKKPMAFILSPKDSNTIGSGINIIFQGYAYDLENGLLNEANLQWNSDVDGFLGNGEQIISSLSQGEHTITFSATDLDGNVKTSTVRLYVGYKLFMPMSLK